VYVFTLKSNALKVAADLGSATLKTGNLRGFGSITMKVVRPGKLKKITACGVVGQGRLGTLRGSLRLALDKTFFRTVSLRELRASLTRSKRSGTCGGTGQPPTKPSSGSLSLSAAATGLNASTFLVTKAAAGRATMMSTQSQVEGPARITHMLITSAPGSAFSAASDLSTAHVDGNAGAPLFGGALDFSSSAPAQSAGKCTMAFGTISGSLTAHFDSIGNKTIGGNAIVNRC
jgi:hypothetical protein